LACQNEFDPPWTDIECSMFKPPHALPPRMHQKLTKHGRFCKQNNQLPTRSHVELKDNYIMSISTKSVFPFLMVKYLDESQRPSQLHCHNPWLLCDVELNHTTMGELGSPTPSHIL
jgi:hypothetical protein